MIVSTMCLIIKLSIVHRTIHNLLCSLACRGAIMFGESISDSVARELLDLIATCAAPFQVNPTFLQE